MAAKEMYDYLDAVSPDYSTTTLTLRSQRVLSEYPMFNQDVRYADDGTDEVITKHDKCMFQVVLQWPVVNASDCGIVLDFFCDTGKAKGMARSFKWTHPTDGHTYVVKFRSNVERQIMDGGVFGFINCQLHVFGKIADA